MFQGKRAAISKCDVMNPKRKSLFQIIKNWIKEHFAQSFDKPTSLSMNS